MKNETYFYNPYTFDESDYTQQELQQLLKDICLGICKPEVSTVHKANYTDEELDEMEKAIRVKRQKRSQLIGEAINRIHATRFCIR